MRVRAALIFLLWIIGAARTVPHAQTATDSQKSGAEIYRAACAACHGTDGKGAPRSSVGFDLSLPDFTDCSFATPEADADWIAIVHQGGSVRAFDRMMPAFGDALSLGEIERVVEHLRTFCKEPSWPRGDLNLPRPLVTEKAFPENEALITTTISGHGQNDVSNEFTYEHRVGRHGQYEIVVPFDLQQNDAGGWSRGLGDIAVAYKHVLGHSLKRGSIVAAGGEVLFPTGKESNGLGGGETVIEPFGTYSQMLPRDGFLHLHAGFEQPINEQDSHTESFWRATVGRTIFQQRWHRAWSPMVEVLGAHEHAPAEPVLWDLVPQMQVSLSRRQHVLVNAGIRTPVNHRESRGTALVVYLLWDWFDGSLFTGW
jgi:Cytochrome C oxidase, cbb3-type, subunit III